eukprot:1054379-Pyramimonas_sp.AAC.1
MASFREVFKTVVRPTIEPKFGDPGPEATLYRMRCIRLFTISLGGSMPKLVARHMFPHGDWRVRGSVQFFFQGGVPTTPMIRYRRVSTS